MIFRTVVFFAVVICLCASQSGCDGKIIQIDGVVTNDDKPVVGAIVMFMPASGQGRPATGTTDARGRFSITSISPNDGVPPGDYKVTVVKDGNITTEFKPELQVDGNPNVKIEPKKPAFELHPNYAILAKTPLKVTVPPGKVTLALKSDGT